MIKKSFLLLVLFFMGFLLGLKADTLGINSTQFMKNLDEELAKYKQAIVTFGESLGDEGWLAEGFGIFVIFIGNWIEWFFFAYVIVIVIRMVIDYYR